jgi:endonuclease/exonuclease/phosphatase family metal-dependent hydrolase
LLRHANDFGLDVPVLAAGDFNFDVSLSPAAATLEEMRFLNPFASLHQTTTNSHSLLARGRIIDWILLRGPLKAVDPKVHNSVVASDHYPLSLTVSFL